MGDPIDELLDQVAAAAGLWRNKSPFCVGTVLQAGGGTLRVGRGELALEKGDLWADPRLNWTWTEDDGSAELLRAGDRVVLLTLDDQSYYLVCKAVRP